MRDGEYILLFCIAVGASTLLSYIYRKIQKHEEEKARRKAIAYLRQTLERERFALEEEINKREKELEDYKQKLDNEKIEFEKALKEEIQKKEKELEDYKQEIYNERVELKKIKEIQQKMFKEKTVGFPWVADMYTRFVELKYIFLEKWLKAKKNPAYQAAEVVADVKREMKQSERSRFYLISLIKYYESAFPWLKEVQNIDDSQIGHLPPSVKQDIEKEYNNIANRYNVLSQEKECLARAKDIFAKEKATFLTEKKQQEELFSIEKEKQKELLAIEKQKQKEILSTERQKQEELLRGKIAKLDADEELREKLFEEKTIGFPWVAQKYAELKTLQLQAREKQLLAKRPAATKSAAIVRECRKKLRDSERQAYIYKGIVGYYEALFPWLADFREAPDESIRLSPPDAEPPGGGEEHDPAKKLLSKSEWDRMSITEKFQTALDRYKKRKKSNWEIGRDFERYIGYVYESQGWNVSFFGALKGFEDMGRDLILTKSGKTVIIQCKYWKKDKIIHEKHLFQLYGTCIVYGIENNLQNPPYGVFITSCALSETARKVADALRLHVRQHIPIKDYPCIKCNVGKEKEKIYHLPFDQQYDKIKMTKGNGCFYAATVAEAEAAGFRRAWRWHGQKS